MGNSAVFTGSASQGLSVAPSATINRTAPDDNLFAALWLYFASNTYYMLPGRTAGPLFSWYLYRSPTTGKISVKWCDSSDGLITGVGNMSAGSVAASVGSWHLAILTYNGSTKQIALEVDRGAPVTATLTHGLWTDDDKAIDFTSTFEGFNRLVGRVDNFGIGTGALPTTGEKDELYNGGEGASWADLSPGLQAKFSAWWDLDETGGDRADSTGNNNTAVQTGTVGYAAGVGGIPIEINSLTVTSSSPTSIQFEADVTGGEGALTVQLQRKRHPTDVSFTTVDTATETEAPFLLNDTPNDGKLWHYSVHVTDSKSPTPQTSDSPELRPASLWKQAVYIVKAGDSIDAQASTGVITDDTASGLDAEVLRYLESLIGPRSITYNSQAVSGAFTSDFAPLHVNPVTGDTVDAGQYWTATKAAIDAGVAAVGAENTYVSYKLGTNDGNSAFTAAVGANLTAVKNYVESVGAKLILHYPPYSSATTEADFQKDWQDFLDDMVDGETVFAGGKDAYLVTASRWPDIYADGATHFNAVGQRLIAVEQAEAVARVIEPRGGDGGVGGGIDLTETLDAFGSSKTVGQVLAQVGELADQEDFAASVATQVLQQLANSPLEISNPTVIRDVTVIQQ